MTLALIATADPDERCADCGVRLPKRSASSPAERRCQDCWWTEQDRRYQAGEPVHPLAVTVLARRHSEEP